MHPPSNHRVAALGWSAFLLLVLLESSRWVILEVSPQASSSPRSQFYGCVCAALVFLGLSGARASRLEADRRAVRDTSLLISAGAMLSTGPAIPFLMSGHSFDVTALASSLMLTSVVIVVMSAAFGVAESSFIGFRLWPPLIGLAGLLLLIAQPTLGELRADACYLLAPILTGVGAVLLITVKRSGILRITFALCGASVTSGVVLLISRAGGTASTTTHPYNAAALDGVCAILNVASLMALGAGRWSGRYILVPLLVVLQGFIFLKQPLGVQEGVGCALLIASCIGVFWPSAEDAFMHVS